MIQPADEPMSDAALIQVAKQVMEDAKFPFLATMDGECPKVRPVSPVRVDGFVVYIANLPVSENATNPSQSIRGALLHVHLS